MTKRGHCVLVATAAAWKHLPAGMPLSFRLRSWFKAGKEHCWVRIQRLLPYVKLQKPRDAEITYEVVLRVTACA